MGEAVFAREQPFEKNRRLPTAHPAHPGGKILADAPAPE
jgi:hypothetical protein